MVLVRVGGLNADEQGMLNKDDLERIWQTALDAGLSDPQRRGLLLAWIPKSVVAQLARTSVPSDQLRSDLDALLGLEHSGVPALSLWLENAERLTDYLPGIPGIFAAMRRKLTQTTPADVAVAATRVSAQNGGPQHPPTPIEADASPSIEVLFFAAQPATADALQIGRELKSIQASLRHGPQADRLTLGDIHMATEPRELQRLIGRSHATVLHFSGHGLPGGGLSLETADGAGLEVEPEIFVELIDLINGDRRDAPKVNLIVVNACHSSTLAQALTDAGAVDCAVGTTEAVADKAAIAFADGFYNALAEGRSVHYAWRAGCLQVGLLGRPYSRYKATFVLASAEGVDPNQLFILPQ